MLPVLRKALAGKADGNEETERGDGRDKLAEGLDLLDLGGKEFGKSLLQGL